MQTLVFMIKMCSSRKYPYLPHGRNFFLKSPPPLPLWKYLWKFQFKLDTFLYIFLIFWPYRTPPTHRKFQSFLWEEYGYFLELHKKLNEKTYMCIAFNINIKMSK